MCIVVSCILDEEVPVTRVVLIFCISETLALATIGVKLLEEDVGLATIVLFVIGVLCNSTTEVVT